MRWHTLVSEALSKNFSAVPDLKYIDVEKPVQFTRSGVQKRTATDYASVIKQQVHMLKVRPLSTREIYGIFCTETSALKARAPVSPALIGTTP